MVTLRGDKEVKLLPDDVCEPPYDKRRGLTMRESVGEFTRSIQMVGAHNCSRPTKLPSPVLYLSTYVADGKRHWGLIRHAMHGDARRR